MIGGRVAVPALSVPGVVVLCAAACGALLWFGTGLNPWPVATWLMPIPLYIVGATVGWRAAFVAGLVAGTAGGCNLVRYALQSLELPMTLVALYVVVEGVSLAAVAGLYGALTQRGYHLRAVIVPAALWVTLTWLMSIGTPNGAFLALGYSQASLRPVLAVASLTGVWGIDFLLFAAPALLVTAAISPAHIRWIAAAGFGTTAVIGYGLWFDQTASMDDPITVAAIAVYQPDDPVDIESPEGQNLLRTYQEMIKQAVEGGAQLVVLPEKTFAVTPATERQLTSGIRAVMFGERTTVVAGALLTVEGQASYNVAVALDSNSEVNYRKQHLVPGLESDLTAGANIAVIGPNWGLAICKDLDFPDLPRRNAREGAGLLAVPAWDFGIDGWLHSRMAITRGVESGIAIVRSARDGQLTLSDNSGQVRAEVAAPAHGGEQMVVAEIATSSRPTLFARFGYWFEWICIIVISLTATRLAVSTRSAEHAIDRRFGSLGVNRGVQRQHHSQ